MMDTMAQSQLSVAHMPRKPKPPPVCNMLIEGLSTLAQEGEAQRLEDLKSQLTFEDDIAGGTVHSVAPQIAQRIIHHAKVIEDYAMRRKALHIENRNEINAMNARRDEVAEAIVLKQFTPQPPAKPFKRRF